MARMVVRAEATSAASPGAVWGIARDFASPWHPMVAEMWTERRAGALFRAFRVAGEDTTYRERLTWFSDTDRVMAYEHLEGIAGADDYKARLSVRGAPRGAVIVMEAVLSAPRRRATEIAQGTKTIFDIGVRTLAALAEDATQSKAVRPAPERSEASAAEGGRIDVIATGGVPSLTVSKTPDAGDPLVLFLHGIGGRRSNWDAQLAALSGSCSAAALDLRGYGDSAPGPAQSTVEDYCADILRVAEALAADRLILCGLSYGAWIATSFAMRHADLVGGLILSGGCTGMSEAPEAERAAFRQAREVPLDAGQSPADFAPAVVDVIAGPEAGAAAREALLASMSAISAATYRDALTCFTAPPERFDFSKLTMPVLMMTGEHDRLAPPDEIRSVAARIHEASPRPDVRFEVIGGAGHVCNLEAPEAYNRHLLRFVARLTSSPRRSLTPDRR